MPKSSINFTPIGRRGMRLTMRTEKGWVLEALGDLDQERPDFTGSEKLSQNLALTINLWAYACSEKERRLTRSKELARELEKRARSHYDMARNLGDLVDKISLDSRDGGSAQALIDT